MQALGRLRAKLGRSVRRISDLVPPTGRGSLVAGASAGVWAFGNHALDYVLFVVGLAGLVLVACASLFVGAAALVLSRRLRPQGVAARSLEAGSPLRTGFRARSLGAMPLLKLRWEWLWPEGVEVRPRLLRGWLNEEVVASRRCHVSSVRRRFTLFDVFGLARVAWEVDAAGEVMVLPNVGRLRNMPVIQSMAGGEGIPHPGGAPEGDRMDIRRYVPGDSVRNIMWKTYARTRQLNVRTPERAIARSRKTVAYLVSGRGDEPAAAAARVAIESGVLGRKWLFGADGAGSEPTDDPGRALVAIARSGSAESAALAGGGLGGFLDAVSSDGEVHCIVFAPARGGAWLETVLEAARRYPGSLSFVLGTDGVARSARPLLWRRLLLSAEPEAGTPAAELAGVLRRLSGAGSEALVVDRLSGRPYGHVHHKALAAIST
jgi:hypothetical protein